MDTYSILREFADSWMLLTLFLFFLAVLVWAFRPGSRQTHQEAATAIFRHDTQPAGPARPDQEG